MGVFDPFKNMTVGFDDIFDQLSTLSQYETPNYPPYNIKKVGKDKYQLDMALAGFKKEDVIVEVNDNTLTVSGKAADKEEKPNKFFQFIGTDCFHLAELLQSWNSRFRF